MAFIRTVTMQKSLNGELLIIISSPMLVFSPTLNFRNKIDLPVKTPAKAAVTDVIAQLPKDIFAASLLLLKTYRK